jgi:hypothetical protein
LAIYYGVILLLVVHLISTIKIVFRALFVVPYYSLAGVARR